MRAGSRRTWNGETCSAIAVESLGPIKAKFHYTDTGTDFFAAKRTRTDPTEFRRKEVLVRVVEFSY